jgi:ABC-type transport system involved in Fe-S cluster assembly fused permease/ATPase subunit
MNIWSDSYMKQERSFDFSRFLSISKDLMELIFHRDAHIKRRFYYALFLLTLTILLNVLAPFLLKELVMEFSSQNLETKNLLIILGFSYAFCWGMSQITMQLREIISFRIIERLVRAFTLKIFDKVNSFSTRFFIERQLGDILETINKAQQGFPYLLTGLFFYLIPTLVEILLICLVLIFLLPLKFTMIFLSMLIAYVAFSLWGMNKMTSYQEKSIDKSHLAYSQLVDLLLNYETIKIFCKRSFESKHLDEHFKDSEEAQIRASVFIESIRLGQGTILGLSLLALTITSLYAFMNNEIRLEGFILINAYFMQLSSPLNYFTLIIQDIQKGMINISRAYDVLSKDTEYNKIFPQSTRTTQPHFKTIEFKKVSFGYHPEKTILKDLDFFLEQGKIISLVGETGSGKSTIAKLLLRLYDPTAGQILIDNKEYTNYDLDLLRSNIGYVSQDPTLFCNTLRYNLTYGNPKASQSEIQKALENAKLDHFVASLPQGLDTLVGERGVSLSGGEKQRLVLARIFLTEKKLYIFDEATSALDPHTQQAVQSHILSLKKKACVLIISHNLTSIADSDEILVLSNGSLIEKGSHASLLSLNQNYATLWNKDDQRIRKHDAN